MADVIGALHRKREHLKIRRARVEMEAKDQLRKIDREIEEIDQTLVVLNNAVKDYICTLCDGTGSIRQADAAGQMEEVECPKCRGTGLKRDQE